jgi:glutamine synthetase
VSPRNSRAARSRFVERHGLWSAAQQKAALAVEKEIGKRNLELVRFSFVDQHGILRGKTVVAKDAARAMRAGVTMTSTLLAKDTSHRNVFAVFGPGGGMDIPEMAGAGNIVMVADPATFRVLPWAENSGWMLCDIYFDNGKPVPVSTRALYRAALARLAQAGFDYLAGLEVEFHLFKIENYQLAPKTLTWPPEPPTVSHTTHGFQYLTEGRFDQVEPMLNVLRRTVAGLGLPLRSLEVELGPSQYEFTFAPELGLVAADTMVLLRSALKQAARRHGYLVSFMCRPGLPNTMASGWHLHQSLIDRKSRTNAFVSADQRELLSPLGRAFLAGLLTHARAASAFTTPTINGYKRYHGVNTMAPIQAIWARDNRGVMIRVLGEAGDPATHLENRIGEPLANPYLYMASQIYAGLDGIERKLDPGPSADAPYQLSAEPLPKTLEEAIAALRQNACLRAGFGTSFVDYFAHIKEAELARFRKESGAATDHTTVSAWEQREYFDLF